MIKKMNRKDTSEIMIRRVSPDEKDILKKLALKNNFDNLNQFMLWQINKIVHNGELDNYQNKFADDLLVIKDQQTRIINELMKQNLQEIRIEKEMKTSEFLIQRWIEFFELVEQNEL